MKKTRFKALITAKRHQCGGKVANLRAEPDSHPERTSAIPRVGLPDRTRRRTSNVFFRLGRHLSSRRPPAPPTGWRSNCYTYNKIISSGTGSLHCHTSSFSSESRKQLSCSGLYRPQLTHSGVSPPRSRPPRRAFTMAILACNSHQ